MVPLLAWKLEIALLFIEDKRAIVSLHIAFHSFEYLVAVVTKAVLLQLVVLQMAPLAAYLSLGCLLGISLSVGFTTKLWNYFIYNYGKKSEACGGKLGSPWSLEAERSENALFKVKEEVCEEEFNWLIRRSGELVKEELVFMLEFIE